MFFFWLEKINTNVTTDIPSFEFFSYVFLSLLFSFEAMLFQCCFYCWASLRVTYLTLLSFLALFCCSIFLTLSPFLLCRVEAVGYQRVLQVDLEVNGLMVTQGSREVTWQVEYPLTRTLTSEVQTLIRLAPQDLGGIVPLAMVRNEALVTDFCASLRIFWKSILLKKILNKTKHMVSKVSKRDLSLHSLVCKKELKEARVVSVNLQLNKAGF